MPQEVTNTAPDVKRIKLLVLSLRKDLPNDDYATLTWSTREGYPRATVWTTKNNKKEDGTIDYSKIITVPFTFPTMFTLIENLEDMVKNDSSIVSRIECYNNKFVDNKRTDEVVIQSEIRIARSQDGVINIGVKSPATSWYYFPLLPETKWHKFYNKDGVEITDKRILSNIFAKAYIGLLNKAFSNIIIEKEEK